MDDLSQFFGSDFDPSTIRPMDDYTAIPPGKYSCRVEKSEIKENKARTGHFLEVTLAILDGEFQGRKVWDRINISNPNQTAQEIARRVLSALVLAAGLRTLGPVAELVGKVVVAHVKVKDGQNNVRTYSSPAASVAMVPVAPVTLAPVPIPVAPQVPPVAAPPVVQQGPAPLPVNVPPATQAPVAAAAQTPVAQPNIRALPWKQ